MYLFSEIFWGRCSINTKESTRERKAWCQEMEMDTREVGP